MTTVARELRRRGARRIVAFSRYAPLFENSPDVDEVVDWSYGPLGRLRHWGFGGSVLQYASYDPQRDCDLVLNEPALATMCRLAGVRGTIELRPYFSLLANERSDGMKFDRQIVIQSAGLAEARNKNWIVERYQAVADRLATLGRVIQVGRVEDPPLEGVVDFRGQTTLREAAAILANAELFIGQAGFLMHLARAVNTRSVIVFGGREDPRVFGYAANENLVGLPPCAPCWQRTRCDFHHECMQLISVDEVVSAANRQLARHDTELPVEKFEVLSSAASCNPAHD